MCKVPESKNISIVLFTYIIVHISLKLHLRGQIMHLFNHPQFQNQRSCNLLYKRDNGSLSNLKKHKSCVYGKGKKVDARTVKVNDIAFPTRRRYYEEFSTRAEFNQFIL